MMRTSFVLSFLLITLSFLGIAGATERQGTGPGALLLITEEVHDARGQTSQIRYWWDSPREPAWTVTDKGVMAELSARGIAPIRVGDTNISRIYRRPHLSLENAATLGGILGANQVLVGQVRYHVEPQLVQLGLHGVKAVASVELVAAQASQVRVLKRFTIERQIFASDAETALEQAREQTSVALGALMASDLSKIAGPVGVKSEERLIGLRNAESQQILDEVIKFLTDLETVDLVSERWAAEGIIALEINPGRVDSDDVIEYVLRVLEHHRFNDFRLTRHRSGQINDLAEFYVERMGPEGF